MGYPEWLLARTQDDLLCPPVPKVWPGGIVFLTASILRYHLFLRLFSDKRLVGVLEQQIFCSQARMLPTLPLTGIGVGGTPHIYVNIER